ncbi:MAG: hypothetical protein HZA48_07935 [Planctomycetes bacterium]|nr:hypothetical protein [Planctomycetota bacterium]
MKSEKNQKHISDSPFSAVLAALEQCKVEYIVLGGQAVIAYGASQFTRDADFWINPTRANIKRFEKVLRELKASQRFLPPLKLSYLRKGHGIHFRFNYYEKDFYVDIMGKPPRVTGFSPAQKDAIHVKWHGLDVPVLDLPRLINTKKTDREKDYLIIQSLTDAVFEQAQKSQTMRKSVIRWLVKELRDPRHLQAIAETWKNGKEELLKSGRKASVLSVKNASVPAIQEELDFEKEKLKKENREYWKPFIDELRDLRRKQRGKDR